MTTSQSLQVKTKDGVKFGKELREKEFLFQEGYLNLNHGMYAFVLWVFVMLQMGELMLSSRVGVSISHLESSLSKSISSSLYVRRLLHLSVLHHVGFIPPHKA